MSTIAFAEDRDAVQRAVSSILSEAAESSGFPYSPEPVALQVTHDGQIVGGLTGNINWKWLYLETLAIAEPYRKLGFAKLLVKKAEQVAQQKGCTGVWVDTFTFQAPEFYLHLGYEPFGELPDYPVGQRRIFLRKLF